MKQTAVEWLAEQMLHPEFHNPYIQQAKEMEKEQMLKFGIRCQMDFIKSNGIRSVEDIWEETLNTNG